MRRVGKLGRLTLAAAAGAALAGLVVTAIVVGPSAIGGEPSTANAQEPPQATACPFAGADGEIDLEAMRSYMDSVHGEGSFEAMWAAMGAMHQGSPEAMWGQMGSMHGQNAEAMWGQMGSMHGSGAGPGAGGMMGGWTNGAGR